MSPASAADLADDIFLENQVPTWDAFRHDGQATVTTGAKRSHDYNAVEDFFSDVKKRRVAPSYDPRT